MRLNFLHLATALLLACAPLHLPAQSLSASEAFSNPAFISPRLSPATWPC